LRRHSVFVGHYDPRNENIGPWRDVNRSPKKWRSSLRMRQYNA
jgi:hypothetical protein